MKYPKKYLSTNPNVMKREIKKHGDKEDSDSSAYGPWDADYKSRKAGKGKAVKTKTSKYTKKYKEMFGENLMTDPYQFMNVLEELENEFIDLLESLTENEILEIFYITLAQCNIIGNYSNADINTSLFYLKNTG